MRQPGGHCKFQDKWLVEMFLNIFSSSKNVLAHIAFCVNPGCMRTWNYHVLYHLCHVCRWRTVFVGFRTCLFMVPFVDNLVV